MTMNTTGMRPPFGLERHLWKLYPPFRAKVEQLLKMCEERNLPIKLTSGYRYTYEQDDLYRQGRNGNPGKIVTNANGLWSYHCYGLAVDFCKNIKGEEYSDLDFFRQVGGLGETLGLEWGGHWKKPDMPHLQFRGLTLQQLKAQGYERPDAFIKTWWNEEAGDE